MVFGFNTDVCWENTVYHVQTEARQQAQVLESQVFTQGRCIGKRATSYAARVGAAEFTDEVLHEMLKDQHRAVLEAVREGHLDQIADSSSQTAATSAS